MLSMKKPEVSAVPEGKIPWFKCFKYTLYLLVLVNVGLFFQENWLAAMHTNANGIAPTELIAAFADSIDTLVWLILLILFELETCVIPDHKLVGRLKHILHGVRVCCYFILVYALYGYLSKLFGLYQYAPATVSGLCQVADKGFSYLLELDLYTKITAANCASLSHGSQFLKLPGASILASSGSLADARWLAWTDVINSATWLLVVLVLEIDVRLQLRGQLRGATMLVSNYVKLFLYTILLAAAIYWGATFFLGVTEDFIDFWDALLWILAFALIERNLFEWQEETAQMQMQMQHR